MILVLVQILFDFGTGKTISRQDDILKSVIGFHQLHGFGKAI